MTTNNLREQRKSNTSILLCTYICTYVPCLHTFTHNRRFGFYVHIYICMYIYLASGERRRLQKLAHIGFEFYGIVNVRCGFLFLGIVESLKILLFLIKNYY